MPNIKCIVVEDEPLASSLLTEYISQIPFLTLEGAFKDAIGAMDHLRNNRPDIIFLDIHLPKLKGMAFLRTLTYSPSIIITTAYHQYAVEGFEMNVTDYLLKPFDFERFLVAVNKVKPAGAIYTDSPRDFLFLNAERKKIKVLFSEILYIESQREYVKIVTLKKEYNSRMSTHEIERLLPTHLFKRIHRSFIIAIDKILSYTADEVDVSGVSIPIGRGYKDVIHKL